MATADQIEQVRLNTDEPTTATTYSDVVIGGYIDDIGSVEGASARIWQQKAASYSKLVNTSEGDARRDLSDLTKNAVAMANMFLAASGGTAGTGPRVKVIDRL